MNCFLPVLLLIIWRHNKSVQLRDLSTSVCTLRCTCQKMVSFYQNKPNFSSTTCKMSYIYIYMLSLKNTLFPPLFPDNFPTSWSPMNLFAPYSIQVDFNLMSWNTFNITSSSFSHFLSLFSMVWLATGIPWGILQCAVSMSKKKKKKDRSSSLHRGTPSSFKFCIGTLFDCLWTSNKTAILSSQWPLSPQACP